MQGWHLGFASPHANSLVFSTIAMAQGGFCESLGVALLVNVPALFRFTWAIIKPLLNPRTSKRVFLFGEEGWQAAMRELVADDQLPAGFGGRAPEGQMQRQAPSAASEE